MKFFQEFNEGLESSIGQSKIFAWLFFFNYPIYYSIWFYSNPHSYENFGLRCSASLLCLFLAFKDNWPKRIKKYQVFFWFLIVIYCLPFFFVFMTIKNNFSVSWLINVNIVLLYMFILFDTLVAVTGTLVGSLTAYFIITIMQKSWSVNFQPGSIDLFSLLVSFMAALIIASIFAGKREVIKKEKLSVMKLLAGSMAHELRTPLSAIRSSSSGIQKNLPTLIKGYQAAYQAHLLDQPISQNRLHLMKQALSTIKVEAEHSSLLITMLLTNLKYTHLELDNPTLFSIDTCIENALNRYVFFANQRKKIHRDATSNHPFIVKGEPTLIVHILFNLIKNALYFIHKAGKGKITIKTAQGLQFNTLCFKDTGPGIAKKHLKHIFDGFFTQRSHQGTGIGLAFCKMVMQAHGGNIHCQSEKGHYTEFILSFPIVKEKKS